LLLNAFFFCCFIILGFSPSSLFLILPQSVTLQPVVRDPIRSGVVPDKQFTIATFATLVQMELEVFTETLILRNKEPTWLVYRVPPLLVVMSLVHVKRENLFTTVSRVRLMTELPLVTVDFI